MTATTFEELKSTPRPDESRAPEATRAAALGWAARLVSADPKGAALDLPALAGRAAAGLGLAALYGVALGARQGGRALLIHAVGVPLGLLLVGLLGAPSMFVFLSLCRAPIDGRDLLGTTARGIGSAGLLLSGLAPAAALFVVSSETPEAARSVGLIGLLLGGGVALARTVWEIVRTAYRGALGSVIGGFGIAVGFAAFAALLAMRVWSHVLPILGGGAS